MPHPQDPDRRRYEDAVLAALDFVPRRDPFARAPRRRRLLVVGLVLVHVLFAATFADALSASWSGAPLALAGIAWLVGTGLVTRAIFRTGRGSARPVTG